MTAVRWHYTTGHAFERIERMGLLRCATAGVPAGERPAVWFSTAPEWEPTATKGLIDAATLERRSATREETAQLAGGLVRIGVPASAAPHNFRAFRRLSGITPHMADGLVRSALAVGANPALWFVSFDPVPRSAWRTIERWDGAQWLRTPESL